MRSYPIMLWKDIKYALPSTALSCDASLILLSPAWRCLSYGRNQSSSNGSSSLGSNANPRVQAQKKNCCQRLLVLTVPERVRRPLLTQS